jgi:hypothetical protein
LHREGDGTPLESPEQPLLTWRGASSNNVYIAACELGGAGPVFPRQLYLTYFMKSEPLAKAPAAAILPDGRFVVVYEGSSEKRLWYVTASFTQRDRFLTLAGGEHRLTLPNDSGRRGTSPSIGMTKEGRVVMGYEGTDSKKLRYVSGFVDEAGELVGTERSLTVGNSRRGSTPSVAIDARRRVLMVYQGTDGKKLWYVSGSRDLTGRLVGREFSLTQGDARRGTTPQQPSMRGVVSRPSTNGLTTRSYGMYTAGWKGTGESLAGRDCST